MKQRLPAIIYLDRQHWRAMRDHVARLAPQEACGLVAGAGGHSRCVLPVTNRLHSRTRFEMEPNELLAALQKIDAHGCELLAIYHSHPSGPTQPSGRDVAEAYYPQAIHLIWAPVAGQGWQCRGYSLVEGEIQPVSVVITGTTDFGLENA